MGSDRSGMVPVSVSVGDWWLLKPGAFRSIFFVREFVSLYNVEDWETVA